MDETTNLLLPYILAAQAQKHVTHNEALRKLDALVQISIVDRDLATPPASPADGARFIVAASPSGAWAGHTGKIAAWQDGAWAFYAPRTGWLAWIADEAIAVAWTGSAWTPVGGSSVNPAPLVGVNTTADTTNRLTVSSPASLFNHAGAGHQLKINKNAAANTGTILFQTGFSGRAEMGLAGSDNYSFKVSPDGSAWFDAIVINRTNGACTFPNTSLGGAVQNIGLASINNNSVYTLSIGTGAQTHPFLITQGNPSGRQAWIVARASTDGFNNVVILASVGTAFATSNAVLTGTTGASGAITISAASGNLFIENRSGGGANFNLWRFS